MSENIDTINKLLADIKSLESQLQQAKAEAKSYHSLCEGYFSGLRRKDGIIHQAEEREAALKLKEIAYRNSLEHIIGSLESDYQHKDVAAKCIAEDALKIDPSQPSKYDKMVAVVEVARKAAEWFEIRAQGDDVAEELEAALSALDAEEVGWGSDLSKM